jgi:hypothetical protein
MAAPRSSIAEEIALIAAAGKTDLAHVGHGALMIGIPASASRWG